MLCCSSQDLKKNLNEPACLFPALTHRHAGVLGLASCVQAFPYDVPSWMPQVLLDLGEHLHDPNPIQVCLFITTVMIVIVVVVVVVVVLPRLPGLE